MSYHLRRNLLGVLAVSAALLVSACSSSSGSDSSDATTTTKADATTTEPGDTTTTAVDREAVARAKAVKLTVSDFVDGWEASPHPDGDADVSPLTQCDPTLGDDESTLAEFNTDDFTLGSLDDGDGAQVSVETTVYASEDDAIAAMEAFNDPDVVTCIDAAVKQNLFGSVEGATVEGSLEEADLGLDADQDEAVSGSFVITGADGSTLSSDIGVIVIRTGDLVSRVSLFSLGDQFDVSMLESPIDAIVAAQR